MGYVGLTLSAILSEVGFKVIGYDTNKHKQFKQKITFLWKGSWYLYQNSNQKIKFINKLQNNKSSIYVIAVGTPINPNKKPNLNNIKAAIEVGQNIEKNNLIILRSTIPVGTTRKVLIPIVEKYSQLKCGEDFSIFLHLNEQQKVWHWKNWEKILNNWRYDEKSSERTANFFNYFTNSIVNVPSLEAAEFCKLLDNAYRDHRFAFVNQFIEFCEK